MPFWHITILNTGHLHHNLPNSGIVPFLYQRDFTFQIATKVSKKQVVKWMTSIGHR